MCLPIFMAEPLSIFKRAACWPADCERVISLGCLEGMQYFESTNCCDTSFRAKIGWNKNLVQPVAVTLTVSVVCRAVLFLKPLVMITLLCHFNLKASGNAPVKTLCSFTKVMERIKLVFLRDISVQIHCEKRNFMMKYWFFSCASPSKRETSTTTQLSWSSGRLLPLSQV